jgi:hypothetical protein
MPSILRGRIEDTRDSDLDEDTCSFRGLDGKMVVGTVHCRKAVAGVGQTNAGIAFQAPVRRQSDAVVTDGQGKVVPIFAGRHLNLAHAGKIAQSVRDRILHQGLQYEPGHSRIQQLRRNIDVNPQSFAEAGALNREIVIERFNLLRQPHLGLILRIE